MTGGSEDGGDEQTGVDGARDDSHVDDSPPDGRSVADRDDTERDGPGTADPDERSEERVEPVAAEQSRPDDGERSRRAEGEEDAWRYSVEEVGDEAADDEGNVAGILMRNEPLEAEAIDPENAVFFLLGSLGTVAFVVLALSSL